MGNTLVGGHRLQFDPIQPIIFILDTAQALVESAYLQGSIIHLPDAVVDLLQADIFPRANRRNLYPVGAPTHPATGIDVSDFVVVGVIEGQDLARHRAGGRRVDRCRGFLV